MYPYYFQWNGPICVRCRNPFIETTTGTTTTLTFTTPYTPKHRKPGPAQ